MSVSSRDDLDGSVIDVRQALLELHLLQDTEPTPEYTQLSGGLTNDNVLVQLRIAAEPHDPSTTKQHANVATRCDRLVLRRFRRGISTHLQYNRQQEFANAQTAAYAGVAPPLLGFLPAGAPRHGGGVMAVRYIDGVTLDDDGVARLCSSTKYIGALIDVLRRLHAMPSFGNTFDPLLARRMYEEEVLRLSGTTVSWPGYDALVKRLVPLAARLRSLNEAYVPCHNDLLPANFITQSHSPPPPQQQQHQQHGTLALIDFELSGMAPASWELGNIISENGLDEDQEAIERLVRAYWQGSVDPPTTSIAATQPPPPWLASRIARARAWSIVSMLTWSAWGCVLHLVHAQFDKVAANGAPPAFDYTAWSMHRVRKASAALHDDMAIQVLLNSLQPDELDR